MNPLLSICIPTYNRAGLLELGLESLMPQVREFYPDIEIVISDNCSTDHTPEVVSKFRSFPGLRYHRQSKNIEVLGNICSLAEELANGEYVWLIGDDDMLITGKLANLLETMKKFPDIDYFAVNYLKKTLDVRNSLIRESTSTYFALPTECEFWDVSNKRLDYWEHLLLIESPHPEWAFTAIVNGIFRRSMWCQHCGVLNRKTSSPLSLDKIFPHIKVWASAMIGKPAYYIGDPCVVLSTGEFKDWANLWPAYCIISLDDVFTLYEKLGADRRLVNMRCREPNIRQWQHVVVAFLTDPTTPGSKYFSLSDFMWRNRSFPFEMAKILGRAGKIIAKKRLPGAAYSALRFGNRILRQGTRCLGHHRESH